MFDSPHNDVSTIINVFLISLVSGFISIAQSILNGKTVTWLWVCSEFAAATLLGYLCYDAYPSFAQYLPDWFSAPIAVAMAAHSGGRGLQAMQRKIYLALDLDRRKPSKTK